MCVCVLPARRVRGAPLPSPPRPKRQIETEQHQIT